MIRAHLATFPPRRQILFDTLKSMSPQVDKIFVVLNEYAEIPDALGHFGNVEAFIPSRDLKDTGKFYFPPESNDVVFTIDDDIIYPPDYVVTTLHQASQVDFDNSIIGYQANAWVYKRRHERFGWRNYKFFKASSELCQVDVIGTGTACMLGKNTPDFSRFGGSEGFVDIRFSNLQKENERNMWSVPRKADYLKGNLPDNLQTSSLYNTVTKVGNAALSRETASLIAKCRAQQK